MSWTCPKGEIKKDPMGVVKMCLGYCGGGTTIGIAIGTNSLMNDHLKVFSPQKKKLIHCHFVTIY